MNGVRLTVVVPVYNEESALPGTVDRLKAVLERTGESYEILFVDDGSQDATPRLLHQIRQADPTVGVLTFSRNFGHQTAITAGMEHARGDAIVVIDADLQDPPELIADMLARWHEGYEVVYARRTAREGERAFKRATAAMFYRFLGRVSDVPIPADAGDFRLIDRKVLEVLRRMPERRRYVRGLVAWAGFRQTAVDFVRQPRTVGESKYGIGRMAALAADGLTSFSIRPLYLAAYAGVATVLAATCALALFAVLAVAGAGPAGWVYGLCAVMLLDGAILAGIGVVGVYLGRVVEEARGRPLYVLAADEPPAAVAAGGGARGGVVR